MMNKQQIYDAALGKWGYDAQVLALAEECSELSAAICRFINHKANGSTVADEAADVEILLEQLRHNGMAEMIDAHKARKLMRLAQRVGIAVEPVDPFAPSATRLMADAQEQLEMATAFYQDNKTSNRLAAANARRAISLLMQATQLMVREAQQAERQEKIILVPLGGSRDAR